MEDRISNIPRRRAWKRDISTATWKPKDRTEKNKCQLRIVYPRKESFKNEGIISHF